jgi:hypothetical protein
MHGVRYAGTRSLAGAYADSLCMSSHGGRACVVAKAGPGLIAADAKVFTLSMACSFVLLDLGHDTSHHDRRLSLPTTHCSRALVRQSTRQLTPPIHTFPHHVLDSVFVAPQRPRRHSALVHDLLDPWRHVGSQRAPEVAGHRRSIKSV